MRLSFFRPWTAIVVPVCSAASMAGPRSRAPPCRARPRPPICGTTAAGCCRRTEPRTSCRRRSTAPGTLRTPSENSSRSSSVNGRRKLALANSAMNGGSRPEMSTVLSLAASRRSSCSRWPLAAFGSSWIAMLYSPPESAAAPLSDGCLRGVVDVPVEGRRPSLVPPQALSNPVPSTRAPTAATRRDRHRLVPVALTRASNQVAGPPRVGVRLATSVASCSRPRNAGRGQRALFGWISPVLALDSIRNNRDVWATR